MRKVGAYSRVHSPRCGGRWRLLAGREGSGRSANNCGARGPGRCLGPVLLALVALVFLGGCATGYPRRLAATPTRAEVEGGAGGFPGHKADISLEGSPRAPPTCGGVALPSGWPDLSSSDEELFAPLLACSPSEFVQVQHGVDMPRLLEAL